jgi:hypothetical protein
MLGRVYRIYSKDHNLVYYGSTFKTLDERYERHKKDKTRYETGEKGYVTAYKILDLDDCKIELVKEVEVASKTELEKIHEAFYITNYTCVNKVNPSRTRKQYLEDSRELFQGKHSCICGGKYTYANKALHVKTKKHKRFSLSQQTY